VISVRDRSSDGLTAERAALEFKRSRGPLAVLVIAGLVALASLGVTLKNVQVVWPWDDPRIVRVAVDDVTGVLAGRNEVRIRGLRVGRVQKVEMSAGQPVLTLQIDRSHGPLYANARLALRPQTPLQDMFVDVVDRGDASAGDVGDRLLAARQTGTPVDLPTVLNTFNADTRSRMKVLLNELGAGLDDNGDQLRATFVSIVPFLTETEDLATQIARRGRITRRLVHNLRVLVGAVGERDAQLAGLVASGSDTLGTVAARGAAFDATLRELPGTVREVDSSLRRVGRSLEPLDQALSSLLPVANRLPGALASLERISMAARPALASLRSPVRRLGPIARDLEPAAASSSAALAQLSSQTGRLDRVTRTLVPCEYALTKFFTWTSSVIKFSDANGAYPRGVVPVGNDTLGSDDPALVDGKSCTEEAGR
jgi:ABC-type transporter Mla subunit MlaD